MARNRAGDVDSSVGGESDEAFVPLPLATDLSAGTVVGEYTIDCKLGDGGMATVYGATHPLIGKKAAIKVMNPALSLDAGLVERFMLEARAVNAIGHPNIVDVFSFGRLADGRSYFVMEWLQGETLYDRLWERKLPLDEALDVIDQVCDALEAAHEKGIIHRDLKPANVFLCPVKGRRDLVKLLDFGVAKLIATAEGLDGSDPMSRPPQTMTGQVVGTPDYISPEQARAKPVDGKTDVYALGVIAYEMILGRRPFEADNSADVVRMHLGDAPPPPRTLWPEIPSPLDELLLRMLHKTAARRPSPAEVRAVIRELRGTPPPFDWDSMAPSPGRLVEPAPAASPSSQPGAPASPSTLDVDPLPPPRRRGTLWLAMGLGLIGCGGAMFAAVSWRAAQRPAIAQPLSQPATAPSPAKTELPAPATPAVDDEGTLVVHVDAANARIELDGELIAQSASGARLRVEPGEHALTVTAPGRHHYAGRVNVTTGNTVELAVKLRREADAVAAAAPPPKPAEALAKKPREKRNDPDYLVESVLGHQMKAAVVVLALVVCAPAARAAGDGDALQEAKDHYDRGMAHYELGEFAAAVDEFKAAYALSQAPGLLFNLAQASRLNKDYEQSLHFYRSYLRVRPEAANREDVEKRITELEPIVEMRRRAELEKLAATPPPVVDARPALEDPGRPTVARALPPGGKKERIAGIVVGAAGVGLLAAGIGLGVASVDAENKLSALATQMGSWSPAQASLYQTGQREAAAATGLYVAGGVAVATGAVLYAIGWRKDRARFAVAPAPGGGAQAVWSCAF